jgi:hypothetical protein
MVGCPWCWLQPHASPGLGPSVPQIHDATLLANLPRCPPSRRRRHYGCPLADPRPDESHVCWGRRRFDIRRWARPRRWSPQAGTVDAHRATAFWDRSAGAAGAVRRPQTGPCATASETEGFKAPLTAPMIRQLVHTMRGPNVGTGTSSAQLSALRMARWWHCQQDTASERTPFARTLPRVIGSIDSLKRAMQRILGACYPRRYPERFFNPPILS